MRGPWGVGRIAVIVIAALFLIQWVPYGHHRAPPAAVTQVTWDAASTEQLSRRACFDCHSNETRWPWYASVAPVSWMLQHDVDEGRDHLNFSAIHITGEEAAEAIREAGKEVREGDMPPRAYVMMHPGARLGPAEREALARGLDRSLMPYAPAEAAGEGTGDEANEHHDR